MWLYYDFFWQMLFQYCKFLMPGPLKRGTVGASTLILSKDIDKILLCEVQILMKQTLSRWWIRHKCLYLRTQNITLNQNRYPHRPEQNYFVLFAMRYPVLLSWNDYFYYYYNSTANGKHKDWDDALTVHDTSPDIHVPLLVIGTKQVK